MSRKLYYTTQFDGLLGMIPHYQSYPRMMPFVGSKYGQYGPKILLVAESHYLPPEVTVHLDADKWYSGTEAELRPEDKPGWFNTRNILNKNAGKWNKKGHTIYRHLEAALIEAGFPESDNTFQYVAFMNGFQRPAVSKLSINATPRDVEVSSQTIQSVIDVLKPDHLVFVSTKAKRYLGKNLSIKHDVVPHPASAWWYRPSKRGSGKEQFVRLITDFMSR